MDLLGDYDFSTDNPDPNVTAQISPTRSGSNSLHFPPQSLSRGFSISNDNFNPSDGDAYNTTSPTFNPVFSTPSSNFQSQPPMPPLASVLGARQRTESMNECLDQPSKRLRAAAATEAIGFLALPGQAEKRLQTFALLPIYAMLIYIFAALEAIRTEKQSNEAILYLDSTLTKNTIHTYIRTAMFTPMAGSYVKTFSRDLVQILAGKQEYFFEFPSGYRLIPGSIAVDHLLRDIVNPKASSLRSEVKGQIAQSCREGLALRMLVRKITKDEVAITHALCGRFAWLRCMHDDLEKMVAAYNKGALARKSALARARSVSDDGIGSAHSSASVVDASESASTHSNIAPEANTRWTKMSQYWDFIDDSLTTYMEKFSQHVSSSALDRMARVSVFHKMSITKDEIAYPPTPGDPKHTIPSPDTAESYKSTAAKILQEGIMDW